MEESKNQAAKSSLKSKKKVRFGAKRESWREKKRTQIVEQL